MSKSKNNRKTFSEVPKPLPVKVVETLDALQLLRDAAKEVRKGKWYYLPVLSGQLRSLLIDKAAGSERRLFYIADQLNTPLTVFCMPGVDDPNFPPIEKPTFWAVDQHISAKRQLPAQTEMSFDQVLHQPFLLYQGVRYTPRTLIEWFANKAGDSHLSESLPQPFAEMLTLQLGNLAPLRQMLLQFAEATFVVALNLFRAAVEQELHIVLAIPDPPKGDVYILDAAYPGSSMRLSLMLDARGTPVVRLVGLNGSWIQLTGNRLVTWDRVRHLHLSIFLTDNFHTRVELYLDGESLGSVETEAPLFLIPDWSSFDVFHNKSFDGPPQDFSFGLAELVLVGAQHSSTDRANMLLYEERKRRDPNLKLALYGPNSFGRSPPGKRDLEMEGTVKHVDVGEVMSSVSTSESAASPEAGSES